MKNKMIIPMLLMFFCMSVGVLAASSVTCTVDAAKPAASSEISGSIDVNVSVVTVHEVAGYTNVTNVSVLYGNQPLCNNVSKTSNQSFDYVCSVNTATLLLDVNGTHTFNISVFNRTQQYICGATVTGLTVDNTIPSYAVTTTAKPYYISPQTFTATVHNATSCRIHFGQNEFDATLSNTLINSGTCTYEAKAGVVPDGDYDIWFSGSDGLNWTQGAKTSGFSIRFIQGQSGGEKDIEISNILGAKQQIDNRTKFLIFVIAVVIVLALFGKGKGGK